MKKQLLSALFVAGFAASAMAQSFTVSGPRTIYELSAKKTGTTGRTKYTFFNFDSGKEVVQADSNTTKWDIAFSGANIILNGGVSGTAGVQGQVLTGSSFNGTTTAPETGYNLDAATPKAIPAYSLCTYYPGATFTGPHTVVPNANTIAAIKLADGRYVKFELISYYKGAPVNVPTTGPTYTGTSGIYSFRYLIAPQGTTDWSQLVTKVVGLKSGVAATTSPAAPATYQLFDLASADTVAITSNTTTTTARWAFGFSATTILTNSGVSGPGKDSAQVVATAFNDLTTAPLEDYAVDKVTPKAIVSGSNNGWYNYDFNFTTFTGSHAITAIQDRSIAFHDSLGRYAKVAIENYYNGAPSVACGTSGYYTFSYYYNPYGGNESGIADRDGKDLGVIAKLSYPALPTFSVSSTADINAVSAGTTSDDITVTTNTGDWVASSTSNWVTVANTGATTFKVTVAENTGASRTADVTVTYCNGNGSLPATIKVVQDAATTTGVEDPTLANALVAYPNPSNGTVKVGAVEVVHVTVSDLQGQVVFSGTVEAGAELNTALSTGVYVAKLVSATQNVTQKLIIQ